MKGRPTFVMQARTGWIAGWLILLTGMAARAQGERQEEQPNLVPNPGFEEYAAPPIGWFYKGEHFTEVMKYWSAPTGASPDAFGPRVRVPANWAGKGFGARRPHGGVSMAGVTLYGCGEGKPHCREYLQAPLYESLVIGQEYAVEFWVSPLPRALRIDRIGVHFARGEIRLKTDRLLDLPPQVQTTAIAGARADGWIRVYGRFIAREEANYLIIGNFYPDSLTTALPPPGGAEALPFAYYYVDDVSVRKEEPILPVPVPEDDLSRVEIAEGKVIQLKNIFFETDRAELLPRSYAELNKLLQLMRRHPGMIIQVNGHTDTRGEPGYNQTLSERRARAVVDFLTGQGIPAGRARHAGFGSRRPVASNDTEEGRQLNRRVEFMVLKL